MLTGSGFVSGSDELGPFVRVDVDSALFSETAILKTAYWFTDSYYLFIAKNRASGLLGVELRPKDGVPIERLSAACGEFWNQLLDYEVRQKVFAETSAVRDTLIKKAFFEAKPSPPPGPLSVGAQPRQPGTTDAAEGVTAKPKA